MTPTLDFDAWLEHRLGTERLAALHASGDYPVFLRANTLRTDAESLVATLARYGILARRHPDVEVAVELVDASESSHTPTGAVHHFAGHFMQQSLGSMLPPIALDPQPGERVLDMCAAPGSKTTQLVAMMKGRGEVWANDVSGKRMNPLAAQLDASTACNFVMTRFGAERLPNLCDDTFDKILADVPCTGLGRAQHIAQARERFARKGVSTLPQLQYRLLLAALRMLRVGGRVVYSTCSLVPDENELVLQEVVSRLPVRLVPPPEFPNLDLQPGQTCIDGVRLDPSLTESRYVEPWRAPTPGFFFAILEKTDELRETRYARKGVDDSTYRFTLGIDHPEVAAIAARVEEVYGVPVAVLGEYRYLLGRNRLYILDGSSQRVFADAHRAGTTLALRRGSYWRLSHASIQRFAAHITRNLVELPVPLLRELARDGAAYWRPSTPPETPYPVMVLPGLGPIASIHFDHETARWRWKRARSMMLPSDLEW